MDTLTSAATTFAALAGLATAVINLAATRRRQSQPRPSRRRNQQPSRKPHKKDKISPVGRR